MKLEAEILQAYRDTEEVLFTRPLPAGDPEACFAALIRSLESVLGPPDTGPTNPDRLYLEELGLEVSHLAVWDRMPWILAIHLIVDSGEGHVATQHLRTDGWTRR